MGQGPHLGVSISSPSGEGGGFHPDEDGLTLIPRVSISSPSGEGGGRVCIKSIKSYISRFH